MIYFLQFTVRARDQSYPERQDTATVQIDIIRDQFAPIFSSNDYRVTIPETQVSIFNVLFVFFILIFTLS